MPKKNENILTIGFNKNNSNHKVVAGILNAMPRGEKANYITKAILYYEEGNKDKIAQSNDNLNYEILRNIVFEILEEHKKLNTEFGNISKSAHPIEQTIEENISDNMDALHGILSSLNSFRL